MKPLHAGSNYKTLHPFFQKMERTGQNTFKAGLGGSHIVFENLDYSFLNYGRVFRIRYLSNPDWYFEVAINDEQKTMTPLRFVDRNAVSLDNSVASMKEISCFWFSWQNPIPKEANMRKVDTLLWEWLDKLIHREYYNAKYA